jgi:hypothetical protein
MHALFDAIHAALAASIPLVCFLTAVIWLAGVAERTGIAGRVAHILAGTARGSTARLYVLVCLAFALLTATLSLDGAVGVMVPVILALVELGAPGRPLLLATVGVANAFSIAVVAATGVRPPLPSVPWRIGLFVTVLATRSGWPPTSPASVPCSFPPGPCGRSWR